jgi:AraC-like DNA-binding protein
MHFHQLQHLIPRFERIETHQASRVIDRPAGSHALIVVRRGNVQVSCRDEAPVVVAQGFACHPDVGPVAVDVPKTKKAEYAVIVYRMLPEGEPWTLHGPLFTLSEVKIRYMVDELIRTAREIHPETEDDESAQTFRKRMILERILFIFLYESRMRQVNVPSAEAIEESISYMNEHYMLKLTVPMMARRAGMSEGHYAVLFKKRTGTTVTAYLRRLRIDKAKTMFGETALTAKEIAQTVGFSDYFHFSKVFKAETGLTPSEYRRSLSEIEE